MKRFYQTVTVGNEEDKQYSVLLDGKPVRTPSGKNLCVANENIADALCKEWDGQKETINPQTMPVTQIVTTHLDHVALYRPDIERQVLNYLNTDRICYRAEGEGITAAMARRQAEKWDKWIEWYGQKSGVDIKTTTDLTAIQQDEKAQSYARDKISAMDDFEFTLLQILTSETGSLILALAFLEENIRPREILEMANVEDFLKSEIYNTDFYGQDPHLEKQWAEAEKVFIACRLCCDSLKS